MIFFTLRPGDSIRGSSSEKQIPILSKLRETPFRIEHKERDAPKDLPRLQPIKSQNSKSEVSFTKEQPQAILSREGQPEPTCQYRRLDDLTDAELHPKAGDRHMVTPPQGGKMTLVCCETSKGPLNIVAHDAWAPIGAGRFLDMVKSGYMNAGIPMMRCIKNFLCQFGLNAKAERNKDFDGRLPDDPNWLPEGPDHRENSQGVKRFAQGYLAYAGGGKNTRGTQLIVALKANGPLAGGSPWEVPWGELVHAESYETLSKIYTGYGEDGPPQGPLRNKGMTEEMKEQWPLLDYIHSCQILDARVVDD